MNQINPLHIGALLGALLLFLLFTLSGIKAELEEERILYLESEKLAVELHSLKDAYADKKKSMSALERVLAQNIFKSAELEIKKEKNSLKVVSKSINMKSLNALMAKILNASYNIKELQIKKLSESRASLEMEIQW